ncbi:MAG: hypothetical protein ACLTER_22495 [Ruminococcus sp.]
MYQKFQEKAGGCDQTWRWCGTVSWIFEGAGEDRIKKMDLHLDVAAYYGTSAGENLQQIVTCILYNVF